MEDLSQTSVAAPVAWAMIRFDPLPSGVDIHYRRWRGPNRATDDTLWAHTKNDCTRYLLTCNEALIMAAPMDRSHVGATREEAVSLVAAMHPAPAGFTYIDAGWDDGLYFCCPTGTGHLDWLQPRSNYNDQSKSDGVYIIAKTPFNEVEEISLETVAAAVQECKRVRLTPGAIDHMGGRGLMENYGYILRPVNEGYLVTYNPKGGRKKISRTDLSRYAKATSLEELMQRDGTASYHIPQFARVITDRATTFLQETEPFKHLYLSLRPVNMDSLPPFLAAVKKMGGQIVPPPAIETWGYQQIVGWYEKHGHLLKLLLDHPDPVLVQFARWALRYARKHKLTIGPAPKPPLRPGERHLRLTWDERSAGGVLAKKYKGKRIVIDAKGKQIQVQQERLDNQP